MPQQIVVFIGMSELDLAKVLNLPKLPFYFKQINQRLAKTDSKKSLLDAKTKKLISRRGKKLRSALLIAAAHLGNDFDQSNLILACCSIENLHLASLIHDDIIDDASIRWNQPALHKQLGLDKTIVLGDYLFAKACFLSAQISQPTSQLVSDSYLKMCLGQNLELEDKFNLTRSKAAVIEVSKYKTAQLFIAALKLGGLCAGLSQSDLTHLNNFGLNFGLAFQLIDDTLDYLSSPSLLGKPTLLDLKDGNYTMPIIFGLKTPWSPKIKKIMKSHKPSQAELARLLIKSGSIEKTLKLIKKYNKLAAVSLAAFKSSNVLGLKSLPEQYLTWAINHKVRPKYRKLIKL
jgi:heptaprenyl diphosphate synthase